MPHHYLTHYAAAEATDVLNLAGVLNQPWQNVLCLPALNETPDFIYRLTKHPERLLLILVVNQTQSPITLANQALITTINQQFQRLSQHNNLALYTLETHNLLLVDRANAPLPAKTGVGLARKIAADIALQLIQQGAIKSHWIYCTDADAQLPDDYFGLDETSPAVAASLPFTHVGPPGPLLDATTLYEHAIRYYAQGLRMAGSGYGFLSLGSALAVKARAYATVRGFNLREAGEDFYLLNKLAKIGEILTPETTTRPTSPIQISARFSNRTPFGTGQSVTQISQLPSLNDYHYYAPACFLMLKHWFELIPKLTAHNLLSELTRLPHPLQNALLAQNIHSLAEHLNRQGTSPKHIKTTCHTWLDGFRTLKIIRYLQAHYFPAEPLLATLARKPFG
ncbi:MAG: hypothetical protein RL497_3154 [Pseudomonadota bacterium]|jgi:hypothetical protein